MKSRIKYYPITQGHIVVAWYLLFLSHNYKEIKVKEAISIANQSGKLGGTVPTSQGLKLCVDYGFLRIQDDELHVTEMSKLTLIPKCDRDELNTPGKRAFLRHILTFHNFEWLIFYNSDPEIFRAHLLNHDRDWASLLENASLFDFENKEVIIWWNKVLSKYEKYKIDVKKAIGDVGEKLTYDHELARIYKDGFNPPKSFVRWASRISDRFGYDILSVRGNYFLASYAKGDKIQIEVKSTDADNLKNFRFYISKPEWITALDNLDSYYFFCWSGINIEKDSARKGPFIIPAIDLVSKVPSDNSEDCQWSECRCVMDVTKYSII